MTALELAAYFAAAITVYLLLLHGFTRLARSNHDREPERVEPSVSGVYAKAETEQERRHG